MIVLLLILSAKTPAPDEKRRKGITKIAPANERMAGAAAAPFTKMKR